MHNMTSEMKACIDECLGCYQSCITTALQHCLIAGGKHVEPMHFRLMLACSEICRTSAHFILLGSEHHKHVCKECAELCEECANSCDEIGGMDDCANKCRECAASCRSMI
ncbi:four-helix bundle copper-binding protein [Roseiarcaceae bacterium H3SJ34-1]|uniref:four-helix bundle copper-binding protein n=1 Tax=Terripilifer ovatus TaxID=3032367 RepID=UPI003AB975BF|nr:four-helix bundle copper-binding protein [Roseiarcaceae bacterium H3SJ34-1]